MCDVFVLFCLLRREFCTVHFMVWLHSHAGMHGCSFQHLFAVCYLEPGVWYQVRCRPSVFGIGLRVRLSCSSKECAEFMIVCYGSKALSFVILFLTGHAFVMVEQPWQCRIIIAACQSLQFEFTGNLVSKKSFSFGSTLIFLTTEWVATRGKLDINLRLPRF